MFAEHPQGNAWRGGEGGKFLLGYWGDGTGNISNIGIISASLIGIPADVAGEHGVGATGVVTFIGIAVAALAVSGGGIALVSRKLKK
jgi:hypothetical protein